MLFLQDRGLAVQIEEGKDRWRLTDAGLKAVLVAQSLRCVGNALQLRADVGLEEATVLELLSILSSDGWKCSTFIKIKRGVWPTPYKYGGDKIFWALPKQSRFFASYLRALLCVSAHGKEVPHFRTERFYRCLVDGETYTVQKRKKKPNDEFTFMGAEPVAIARPAPPSSSSSSSTSSQDADMMSEACASRSPSGNGSSSSSSSTSGSDDEGGASAAAASKDTKHVPDAEHPLLEPGVTQVWKNFKFGPIFAKDGSGHCGWEVTCYVAKHKDGTKCRRRRLFAANDGPAMTERGLKSWCLRALEFSCRVDHRDAPECNPAELPTLRQLDHMEPPCQDAGPAAKKLRK